MSTAPYQSPNVAAQPKRPESRDRRNRGRWSGITAMDMLRIRRRVRHTASLVSTTGPIRERPGPNWAANYRERLIYWRPTDPFTRELMDDDEILMNTVHEAGHLNWTGGYVTPDGFNRLRFHRLWNAVEDIRIERLMSREFPGFVSVRMNSNTRCHEFHAQADVSTYSLHDQVWLSWMGYEENLGGLGSQAAQDFASATWPQISRVANSHDSAQVAEGIAAVFEEMEKAVEENRAPDVANLPDGWDEFGLDELTDHPSRSKLPETEEDGTLSDAPDMLGEGGDGTGPAMQSDDDFDELEPPPGELTADLPGMPIAIFAGMAHDAEDGSDGEQFLIAVFHDERQEEDRSQQDAQVLVNPHMGHGSGEPTNNPSMRPWQNAHDVMRPHINVLTRQIAAKLRTNADDEWEPGLRKGALDMHRAPSSLTGNTRIFRDRHAVGSLDYNFGLGVDVSSSQSSRSRKILEAVVLILTSLENNDLGNCCIPWDDSPGVMKPIGRPLKRFAPYLAGAITNCINGTYEAPSLVAMIDEFAKTSRTATNVFIQITDGQTMGPGESIQLVEELEAMGVYCIGIGVGCSAPHHYETNGKGYSIRKAEELVTLFPSIVNRVIKRGS